MGPFVSRLIEIVKEGRHDFKVIAREPIQTQTVVEICPVMPIPNRLAIVMHKTNPIFEKKILLDRAEIDREYQVFMELGEMELERRLNSGQISHEDYTQILSSKVNFNSLLDAKTHMLPLGYGLLYGISEYPNLVREYSPTTKLCTFRTVQYVQEGTELAYFS